MTAPPRPAPAPLGSRRSTSSLREHRSPATASALVCFSGGVDSTLLLRVAHDVLGDRCHALTAVSVTMAASERARPPPTWRRELGARHRGRRIQRAGAPRLRRRTRPTAATTARPSCSSSPAPRADELGLRRGAARHQPRRSGRPPPRPDRRQRARRAPPDGRGRADQGRRPRPVPAARSAHLGQAAARLPVLALPLRHRDHARAPAARSTPSRTACAPSASASSASATTATSRASSSTSPTCRASSRPACARRSSPWAAPRLHLRRARPGRLLLGLAQPADRARPSKLAAPRTRSRFRAARSADRYVGQSRLDSAHVASRASAGRSRPDSAHICLGRTTLGRSS